MRQANTTDRFTVVLAAAFARHGPSVGPDPVGRLLRAQGNAGQVGFAFGTTIVGGARPSPYRRRPAGIELNGCDPADMTAFCHEHRLREVPRRAILLGGYDRRPVKPAGQAEAIFGLQLMNAVVPDAGEVVVIFAAPDNNSWPPVRTI